jgi:adenosylcobyric acid synthase
MGLARAAGLPVLVVGDIDRGGVFAALFGTVALLDAADQALVAGFVVNKFRGDRRLLEPGIAQLTALTGRPTYGVLPYVAGLWLDVEDSLALDDRNAFPSGEGRPAGSQAADRLRVAVVRLPRVSNFTDVDALRAEPGVDVRFVTSAAEVVGADLAVLPGTRATVADLDWLRRQGLDVALRRRAEAGRPVLGICGGYQMLGTVIDDGVESGAGLVAGLGLLPVRTVFDADKVLVTPTGRARAYGGGRVTGYGIHHGRVVAEGGEPLVDTDDGRPEGCRVGAVFGTAWHGLLENDGWRRSFLAEVATAAGRRWQPGTGAFAAVREARLDLLGDLVAEHLDTAALLRLIERGVPAGLPFVPPGPP